MSSLSEQEQLRLLELLPPEDAAELIEDIPDIQAADLVEELDSQQAARVMEELDGDHLVDVLAGMDASSSREILARMDAEDAGEARKFLEYPADCSGGLMISEFLSYRQDATIREVQDDLQTNREEYTDYHVQYFYVEDDAGRLVGVLQIGRASCRERV